MASTPPLTRLEGDNFKRSFKSLSRGGTLVAYGFYSDAMGNGGSAPLEFMQVKLWNILPNGRSTAFYSIGALREKQPDWFHEDLTALFNLLAQGKIKPVIAERMSLAEAMQAHDLVERAAVEGKIVLMVSDYHRAAHLRLGHDLGPTSRGDHVRSTRATP